MRRFAAAGVNDMMKRLSPFQVAHLPRLVGQRATAILLLSWGRSAFSKIARKISFGINHLMEEWLFRHIFLPGGAIMSPRRSGWQPGRNTFKMWGVWTNRERSRMLEVGCKCSYSRCVHGRFGRCPSFCCWRAALSQSQGAKSQVSEPAGVVDRGRTSAEQCAQHRADARRISLAGDRGRAGALRWIYVPDLRSGQSARVHER